MLIDDDLRALRARLATASSEWEDGDLELEGCRTFVSTCEADAARGQRFVLSPLTAAAMRELAVPEKVRATREHLFLPAYTTWIEWHGPGPFAGSNRHGIMLVARSEDREGLVRGDCRYVCDVDLAAGSGKSQVMTVPGTFEFDGDGPLISLVRPRPMTRVYRELVSMVDDAVIGAMVGASIALINTPRIAEHETVDVGKLNKARSSRKAVPLLSYVEVTINLDGIKLPRGASVQAAERALHHVRSHFRLQRGRVVLVRPHRRGNPLRGVRVQRHLVRRDGDVRGDWTGGPLPAPRIMPDDGAEPSEGS